MGRTLGEIIASESPEVVQRAKALAEEQRVRPYRSDQIAFKYRGR